MTGAMGGSHFLTVNNILIMIGLQPHILIIALVCSLLGALILSRFTRSMGMLTYPINFIALFAGSVVANVVMKGVRLPLDYGFERPLFISVAGMAIASLLTLIVLSRDRLSD